MRLSRSLLRARRRRVACKRSRGRPSAKADVIIRAIIDHGKWSATRSLKALTTIVNRKATWPKRISEDTVKRSLDELLSETGDRRFQQLRRAQLLNPARGITRYREARRERFLTSEELARLGDALREAETVGVPWVVDEQSPKAKHVPKDNRRTKVSPYATAALRLLLLYAHVAADPLKTIASKLAAKIGEPAVATKDGSKITRADFKRGRT